MVIIGFYLFSAFLPFFSVEVGLIEKQFDISCRDPISNVILFTQPNTTHLGKYSQDNLQFNRNGLIHTYISSGISSVKIPSLPCGNNGGELEGYDFSTPQGLKASYWYVLSQLGKLDNAKELPFEHWSKDRFLLPFCLSAETQYGTGPALLNKIQPKSISPSNQFSLYLKFDSPTTKVLRVVLIYSQQRALSIEHDRTTFRSYEVDQ